MVFIGHNVNYLVERLMTFTYNISRQNYTVRINVGLENKALLLILVLPITIPIITNGMSTLTCHSAAR